MNQRDDPRTALARRMAPVLLALLALTSTVLVLVGPPTGPVGVATMMMGLLVFTRLVLLILAPPRERRE